MTEDSPAAPAGWYPTPSGDRRYWDGGQWLALPSPDDESAVQTDLEPRHFAPDTDAADGELASTTTPKRKAPAKKTVWILAVAATAILLAVVGGVAWQASENAKAEVAAAEAAAAEAAQESAEEAAAEKEAAQERADDAERETRKAAVTGIEESVEKMATGHVEDGLITGPVIKVTCSPVGGGSTEDLTETTTVFECFVANKDNDDGTMSGILYSATMNWATGSYNYGLGAP